MPKNPIRINNSDPDQPHEPCPLLFKENVVQEKLLLASNYHSDVQGYTYLFRHNGIVNKPLKYLHLDFSCYFHTIRSNE